MNIGEFGNFLSYAYAPASVVAPLGTVGTLMLMHEDRRLTVDFQFALIANCIFAPLILGERFRKVRYLFYNRFLTSFHLSLIASIRRLHEHTRSTARPYWHLPLHSWRPLSSRLSQTD